MEEIRIDPGGSIELSPFALLRVAAVPLRRLTALATPASGDLVASVVDIRSELELLRPRVEGHLHALVPKLQDREFRSAVIGLRRDVHGGRLPRVEVEVISGILALLSANGREDFQSWHTKQLEIAELVERGESVLEEETANKLRTALMAALDDPRLSLGIAMASPELRNSLDQGSDRLPPSPTATKHEMAVLSYLLRAVCKTSPFSTFMDVGTVSVAPEGNDDPPSLSAARRATSLRINRGILARLYSTVVPGLGKKGWGLFHPNPTMRRDSQNTVRALAAEQVALLGAPWRQERLARFRLQEATAKILLNLPAGFSLPWLRRRFEEAGLTEGQSDQFTERLIERELILADSVIDAFTEDAIRELRVHLASCEGPEVDALRSSLIRLESSADASQHTDWAERVKMDQQIRETEKSALEAFGHRTYEGYRNVLFEESRLEGVAWVVGRSIHDLITEVGHFLRSQFALREEFVRLQDAFRQRFGPSGVCTDIVGFLSEQAGSFVDSLADDEGLGTQLTPGRELVPPKGTRVGLTAFVQIAANCVDDEISEPFVVVNRVYEGVGWLSARHAVGNDQAARALRRHLRCWLDDAYAPAEPVDFPLSGHCNDLQAHPRLTRRVLAWPGEPIRADRAEIIPIGELALRMKATTGLLELVDDRDQVLAPVYLGSILPVPTWGPSFGLAILASPIKLLRPSSSIPVEEGVDVTFYPRQMYEHVVLSRASWSVRTSYLFDSFLKARHFQRLINMVEFCDAHAIPRMFFARAQRWLDPLRRDSPINARKPTFVDTSNTFCLDLLERVARDADTIVLTEVLPTHKQAWRGMSGDHHVTELQLEMCVSAEG